MTYLVALGRAGAVKPIETTWNRAWYDRIRALYSERDSDFILPGSMSTRLYELSHYSQATQQT